MTSRERIRAIIQGSDHIDRCGFWLGDPMPETLQGYLKYFDLGSEKELREFLQDDFRWIMAERNDPVYLHPEKKPFFPLNKKKSLSEAGPLAHVTSIEQLEEYEWPKLEYLNLDATIRELENQKDHYRASGFWTPFYHNLMDLFGMEEYLVKMYTHPEVVHEVTDIICEFYYDANNRESQDISRNSG